MFGLEILSGSTEAISTMGFVFIEAISLYVGYGVLSGLIGSQVLDRVRGD